jgi:hypothetical protein
VPTVQEQGFGDAYSIWFGTFLGLLAMGLLLSSPWQVDTSGPDPFYKGPLLFPLMVLSLIAATVLIALVPLAMDRRKGRKGP